MNITLLTGRTYKIEQALGYKIKLNISAKNKKMTLSIDSKNRMPRLSMPLFCSTKKAVDFVQSHETWIREHMREVPRKHNFTDGLKLSLFGRKITIKHRPDLKIGAELYPRTLYVSGQKTFLHRRVKDFIRKEAKSAFAEMSRQKAKKIGCEVNRVVIKDTASRWGSCSSNMNINYTWRLALAPDYVIDYLISHEVAHLKHQDHSTDFWRCVKRLCPDYVEGKNWLRDHGKDLHIYK